MAQVEEKSNSFFINNNDDDDFSLIPYFWACFQWSGKDNAEIFFSLDHCFMLNSGKSSSSCVYLCLCSVCPFPTVCKMRLCLHLSAARVRLLQLSLLWDQDQIRGEDVCCCLFILIMSADRVYSRGHNRSRQSFSWTVVLWRPVDGALLFLILIWPSKTSEPFL